MQTQALVDPLAGTDFRTVGELGAGGMGAVLLAEHVQSKHRYAVKVLLEKAPNEQARERFRLEADAIRALRDKNVVRVHDRGFCADGSAYIVMELLEGASLDKRIHEPGVPIEEAIGMAIQIYDGLAACHKKGILHRDIKPANLFECDGPAPKTIKLTDFGLAKVFAASSNVKPLEVPTADNTFIGTPRWCSPEALYGDPNGLQPSSDVYSAGLVLYALASGRLPWVGVNSRDALADAQLNRKVGKIPGGYAWLDDIVARLTAKKASERVQTAAEAAAILRACLKERFGGDVVLLTTDVLSRPGPQPSSSPTPLPRTTVNDGQLTTDPLPTLRADAIGDKIATRPEPRPITRGTTPERSGMPLWVWAIIGILLAMVVVFAALLAMGSG